MAAVVSNGAARADADSGAEAPPATAKSYTAYEVAKHADSKSCWLIIANKVYAVESFLADHPGGEDVLLETAGREATREFEDVGHSRSAREQLQEFYIGDLREATAEERAEAEREAKEKAAATARRAPSGDAAGRIASVVGGGGGSSLVALLKRLALPAAIALVAYLVRMYTASVVNNGNGA